MPDEMKSRLPVWFNAKLLLAVIFGMVIAHIIVFLIYSQNKKSAEFDVNRNIVARQVINFIQTVQTTPLDEQAGLVKAVDIPNLRATIDSQPKYQEQFADKSLWFVLKNISNQTPNIQLSFLVSPNRWLNITAAIIYQKWGMQAILLGLEFLSIISVLFFLWSIKRFTIPLQEFTEATERLGVDLHAKPVPISGPRVVQVTAKALNRMQERLKDLIKARTQMLAAISHDLRTPITRLKLRAQYIDNQEQYHKIIQDLDEMEHLISETLSFARDDNKIENRVKLDLASLLSSICDDYSETGNTVVYCSSTKRLPYWGGMVALRRVFTNLIGNAIKYGHRADVYLEEKDHNIIVRVEDEGPGIPQHQMENVFLPFYRAEGSRSRKTGGVGLGLAVARDLVRAHGGDIQLSLRKKGGLCVTVVLPSVSASEL